MRETSTRPQSAKSGAAAEDQAAPLWLQLMNLGANPPTAATTPQTPGITVTPALACRRRQVRSDFRAVGPVAAPMCIALRRMVPHKSLVVPTKTSCMLAFDSRAFAGRHRQSRPHFCRRTARTISPICSKPRHRRSPDLPRLRAVACMPRLVIWERFLCWNRRGRRHLRRATCSTPTFPPAGGGRSRHRQRGSVCAQRQWSDPLNSESVEENDRPDL